MPRGKRKARSEEDNDQQQTGPDSKQAKQDGQSSVAHHVEVPLDEGFQEIPNGKVYVSEEGVIFDASLNQTNVGRNNNKFYRLQLIDGQGKDTWYFHARWGRVGEFGQGKTSGPCNFDQASKEFAKKFREKSGNKWDDRNEPAKKGKYTYIERNYEADEEDGTKAEAADDSKDEKLVKDEPIPEPESQLPLPTQKLMELIFNTSYFNSALHSIGYNANKLPLGKLSKATLSKGFMILKKIANLITSTSGLTAQAQMEDLTNQFYSTIPHDFGRHKPPVINNQTILQKEVAMLDTLTDMEVANAIMKSTDDEKKEKLHIHMHDQRFGELQLEEMTPLDPTSEEHKGVADYLLKTTGDTHYTNCNIEDIFRIERKGEADRFSSSKFGKLKKTDKRLLWHGSRSTNFGGILSQGLRIAPPEAPLNGYAFGKGVYLADLSTKSAQYCYSYSSGSTGLLLLVEAELGKPMYEIQTGSFSAQEEAEQKGCISTMGVGKTVPKGWKDAQYIHPSLEGVKLPDLEKGIGPNSKANAGGYLLYDEYICYSVEQLRLRYLLRVKM